ncbi:MAG: hypothetical protein HY043_12970 [Verrucomicrobia bacterium]|nr:hypothetical protein [Verrucomicrobiota bacterium]
MNTNSSALILPSSPTSTAPATNGLHDIKAPVEIPNGWAWLGWTLGALTVAAIAYWAWRYWQKRRAQGLPPEKIIPPHDRARLRLREAEALLDQPKPFCISVSDTIRVYLEERFELHAPERTTEEFLYELQSSHELTPPQKETLGEFLGVCDLVKFARHEPVVAELQAMLQVANRLVNETEPPPPLAPGAQANTAAPPQVAASN